MDCNFSPTTKIEPLTGTNYPIWALKVGALLRGKKLFKCVISDPEPDVKDEVAWQIWSEKNDEAFGIIVTTLSDEQAGMFLDETKAKKKLAQEITQLGKTVTERELVRYIVEGLTPNFDTITAALSINREIFLPDLRQTLLDFEKKRQDRSKNHENAFRSSGNQFKEKSCYICKRKGHFKKDCWFNPNKKGNQNNTTNKNNMASTRNYHKGPKQNKDTARSAIQERTEEPSQRRDSTSEYALHASTREERPTTQDVWIIDSACTSHMTSHGEWIEHKTEERRSIQVAEEGRHIESASSGSIQATVQVPYPNPPVIMPSTSNTYLLSFFLIPRNHNSLRRCILIHIPVNAKVVKSKWVFKISKDQENKTYKARLVAMGYNQIPGRDYNESFSPVIKNATLRTILSMAATKDSVIKLFDVKAAYLNENIENTIFMEQPAGFVQDRNKVCKLNKSIYGLPQSGRSWNEKFSQVLHDCGLEKLKSDPCLFKWKNEDKYLYVGIYVDDFITVSDSEDTSNRFINKLRHHLEIKDVTCKGMFLGIKIIQDKEGISLQQSHYVQQILQKYGMETCKEVPIPGSKEINLDNHIEDDNCDQRTYQEALGMLMFLAVNTRPDIAYITSKLSQYSRQPKQMHWTAIKRVMRYLRGTIDLGVKFERGKAGILKSYTDASWSTTHDGKSYGGYVLKLGEATIDWKSSKQPLVALSTMEAEMIAACESCCQIKWIINLLRELEEWNFMENPTAIYTDSQSLITGSPALNKAVAVDISTESTTS
ncbi:hypothetical protein LAZ67_1008425 [Cordylochernes scorpioides]|uniref:CCHC-type domain-containing protein n=1 Tax=Cordylochernes scorpioides TaxID=51811 RepID=A0ABY6K044_9ARAC|nr:hypothetical protein LAZ67_1008425 [Cordylochernes scorpioides]